MTKQEFEALQLVKKNTTNKHLKDALHEVIERFREKTDAERLVEAEKELERLREELKREKLDKFRSPNHPRPIVPSVPPSPWRYPWDDRLPERGPWENPIIWCSVADNRVRNAKY